MSSLSTEMIADFLSVWEEVPVYLTAGPVRARVLVSQNTEADELQLGGMAHNRTLDVRALRAELPPGLKVGQLVSVDGQNFRVENIAARAGLPIVTINLVEP